MSKIDFFNSDDSPQKAKYTEDQYESYMGVVNSTIKNINDSKKSLKNYEWMARLTYDQWCQFQNGELKQGDPLNIEDVRKTRHWNYYHSEGDIVMLDESVMTPQEKATFVYYIGRHAVVTKCWSDLHGFGQGSNYQHELKFENGLVSTSEWNSGLKGGQVPTEIIISISADELIPYNDGYNDYYVHNKIDKPWYIIDDKEQ